MSAPQLLEEDVASPAADSDSETPLEPEPLVIADAETLTPPGRRFWTEDDMFELDKAGMPVPRFSVQDVAKFFFGRGADWLRLRIRPDEDKLIKATGEIRPARHPHGYFILDGVPMVFKRTPPGARYFTLADVERMGHALAQEGVIDGEALTNVIIMVKACARQYGIDLRLPEPEEEVDEEAEEE